MPELAELTLTAEWVNQRASGQVFEAIWKNPLHKGQEVATPFSSFTISCRSRGKELMLTLTGVDSLHAVKLLMTMGMAGHFKWLQPSAVEKHAHLVFKCGSGQLAFVDVRRFGKWKLVEGWSPNRGPDPIQEFQAFVDNIKTNLHMKDFDKPICEVLMNQKWFNGIGNYLRAEILYRAAVNPFMSARLALTSQTAIYDLCQSVAMTAYLLGGGQLKDWQNPFGKSSNNELTWTEFMQCYGNRAMHTWLDRGGRRLWYDPKWQPFEPS